MALYALLAILAGAIQVATIYLLRVGIFNSFLFAIPFVLIHQYLFLYNYTKAPNFLLVWFLTTAITNLLSIIIGYFFFKDILSPFQIAGVLMILTGVVFLKF
jgi:multidrug transporter EmrE-like cation transporter